MSIDKLRSILQDIQERDIDMNLSSQISRVPYLDVLVEDETWEEDGKYSNGEFTFKVKYEGEVYHFTASQMKSGSYFSDYFYQDIMVDDILTDEEFNRPKMEYEFKFGSHLIRIMSNNTVMISDKVYNTVEEAIRGIL